jgi:predicted nucleic-acid-binding Zn-ribbon protein
MCSSAAEEPGIMKDGKCPKCGSSNVATGVDARAGWGSSATALFLATPKNPGSWFSTAVERPVLASVCGECGYTEFYLKEPKEFVELARRKPQS